MGKGKALIINGFYTSISKANKQDLEEYLRLINEELSKRREIY